MKLSPEQRAQFERDGDLFLPDLVDLPWKDGLPASALQTSLDELAQAA